MSNRTDIMEEVMEMNIVVKTDFWKKLTPLNILRVFHLRVIGIVIVVITIASIFVPPLFYIKEKLYTHFIFTFLTAIVLPSRVISTTATPDTDA